MKRFCTIVGIVLGALGMTAPAARAQCSVGQSVEYGLNNYTDGVGGNMLADALINTKADHYSCWGGYWRVELWFLNQNTYPQCSTEAGTGGLVNGACIAISANTQSVGSGGRAWAVANLHSYGCKLAWSRFWNVNGAWTWISELAGDACGGEPPPDPSIPGYCEYYWNEEYQEWQYSWCPSPILMPLDDKRAMKHKDFKLTDMAHGVRFDYDGDGVEAQTAWTHADSGLAFLALDRNGNGKIDNGTELFGNFTHPGKGNGFSALLVDSNNAGLISEGHPLYERLLLWEDVNHNGLSETAELHKFSDHYLALDGGYAPDTLVDKYGNQFRFKGAANVRDPGKSKEIKVDELPSTMIDIWDVFFVANGK